MKKILFKLFRRFIRLFSGFRFRERFPAINNFYKRINGSLSPSKVIVFNHVMYLDKGDAMGLAVNGVYEPSETRLIQELLFPGNIVIDVGANIGYYTLLYANLVGSSGKVYAFEPEYNNYRLLIQNIYANRFSNVEPVQMAVADSSREMRLYLDRYSNLDHRMYQSPDLKESVIVKTISLDEYFSDLESHIDLIKVDIQGSETAAVKGMRRLLEINIDIKLLIEFWPYGLKMSGVEPEKLLQILSEDGFIFFDVKHGWESRNPKCIEELTARYRPEIRNHTNILCVRDTSLI